MADGAILRELICRVIGIHSVRVIRLVALVAILIHELIVAADMTIDTLSGLMRALDREIRRSMIEGRRRPGIHGMALQAIMREISCDMVWIC